MKFEAPKNKNYAASVVKVKNIIPLDNCDNVVAAHFFGFQVIVSKDTQEGQLGLLFPAETQLAETYCEENNLYRHVELNKNVLVRGYLENNRRVKAVKFRGNRSDALFMPLESLSYLGVAITDFKEGDEFDAIDGVEICKKYIVDRPERLNRQPLPKLFKRVDTKFIPEHFDSDNFFKFIDKLNPEVEVIVTQKLHGTSIRIGHTIVKRKLTLLEKLAQKLGFKIQEHEFDYVFGSRKVIKDANNPDHNHYYQVDIWTIEGKKLEGLLPENYIAYGELVGWTPTGAPIQTSYTYQIPETECRLFIYRIAFVNAQGIVTDLSWDHVKEFCEKNGFNAVPELWRGKLKDFDVDAFMDKRYNDQYRNALTLPQGLVDEGVCIRIDKMTPYILKAKAPQFLQHESKMLDSGQVDLETEGSQTIESLPSAPELSHT